MHVLHNFLFVLVLIKTVLCESSRIKLPDDGQPPEENIEERRNGKHLLDFVDYVTSGQATDPLISKARNHCFNGDMSECFRSQALDYFNDFFKGHEQRYINSIIKPAEI